MGRSPPESSQQQRFYEDAIAAYGAAIDRLARSYEPDAEKWQDVRQDIHLALWRSFERYEARCSLRTWTYRVAHNVATSHLIRRRRHDARHLASVDDLASIADDTDGEYAVDRRIMLERLNVLIQELAPLDRQLLLLYLEGVDAASIGDITGLSASNVAVKVHRIKKVIAARVRAGGHDVG